MKKILTLLMVVLLVALSVTPAFADNYGATPGKGETVDGGTLTLSKYLVTDEGTELPDVKFSYEVSVPAKVGTVGTLDVAVEGDPGTTTVSYTAVAAGATFDDAVTYYSDDQGAVNSTITDQATLDAAIAAGEAFTKTETTTDATVQVYVGIEPDQIKVNGDAQKGFVTFDPTDAADSVPVIVDKTHLDYEERGQSYLLEGEQYNKKDIALDFSAITFTEPGIYRYYLKEDVADDSETDKALFEMDFKVSEKTNENWRTIDVYVVNDSEASNANLTTGADPLKIENYIVYEGKIEKAPKQDIDYEYNEDINVPDDGNFDPTLNKANPSVGMTENNVWTYTVDPVTNERYEYVYDKEDGGWVETYYAANGNITVKRNVTDHLDDAYGGVTAELPVPDAKTAKEMGKTEAEIKGVTKWTAPSTVVDQTTGLPLDLQIDYEWDPTENKWHTTGNGSGSTTAPLLVAKAVKLAADGSGVTGFTYVHESNGTTEVTVLTGNDNNYGNIKNTLKVADSEIQKYIWEAVVDGNTTDTITYTWNPTTKVWDYTIVVDSYVEYDKLPDHAVPTPEMKANKVLYKYAKPIEIAAQKAIPVGYEDALKEKPNGVEAGKYKNDAFANKMETVELTVAKTVTGNQGSKDKYFKFTITLKKEDAAGLVITSDKSDTPAKLDLVPTPNAATEYDVAEMEEANSKDEDDSASGYNYVFKDNDTLTFDIYLQDGESITLKGIPAGTHYSVVEEDANKDGYTTTAKVTRASGDFEVGRDELEEDIEVDRKKSEGGTEKETVNLGDINTGVLIRTGDHHVEFTNKKSGVIPTGVIMSITGGVALIAIAGAGLLALNRRRDEDEE